MTWFQIPHLLKFIQIPQSVFDNQWLSYFKLPTKYPNYPPLIIFRSDFWLLPICFWITSGLFRKLRIFRQGGEKFHEHLMDTMLTIYLPVFLAIADCGKKSCFGTTIDNHLIVFPELRKRFWIFFWAEAHTFHPYFASINFRILFRLLLLIAGCFRMTRWKMIHLSSGMEVLFW